MKRIKLFGGPLDGAYLNKRVSRGIQPSDIVGVMGHPDAPPMRYKIHPSGHGVHAPRVDHEDHLVHVDVTEY